MDRIRKKHCSNKAILYMVSILLLLEGGTMYNCIVNSPMSSGSIKIGIILFCVFYILIFRQISKSGLILTLFLFFALSIYYLVTRYNGMQFATYFIVFIVLSIFFQVIMRNNELEFFLDCFSKTTVFISTISLFFWLFGSFLHFFPKKEVLYIWGRDYPYVGFSYLGIYFENPVQAMGSVIRNTGIYTEAPAYVDRLVIALGIEMFFFTKKTHTMRQIILVLTILSTLSSKGFILLVYLLGIKWVFYYKKRSKIQIFFHACVTIIGAICAVYLVDAIMSMEMSTESSSMTRYDHMYSGFITWLQNPLFGVGYNNTEAISMNHLYSNTPEGASMGIPTFLAEGGIYMFFLYIGSAIIAMISIRRTKKIKEYVFFVGMMMIDWFISNIGYSVTMISLVCLGYATIVRTKNECFNDYSITVNF